MWSIKAIKTHVGTWETILENVKRKSITKMRSVLSLLLAANIYITRQRLEGNR